MKVDKVINEIVKEIEAAHENMKKNINDTKEFNYYQGIAVGINRALMLMSLSVIHGSNTEIKLKKLIDKYNDLTWNIRRKIGWMK